MTSPSPDPDPANTPGLLPGGGVNPGDTPPGESATSGLSHHEPEPGRAIPWVVFIAVGILILMVIGFLVGRVVDLW